MEDDDKKLEESESNLLQAFNSYDDKEKMQFMIATVLLLFDNEQIKILIRQLQQRVQ